MPIKILKEKKTVQKNISVFFFVLLVSIGYISAQDLTVRIENADVGKGHLMIAVFNSGGDFPNNSFREQRIVVTERTMAVTFPNLPIGQYAVSVYQDSNDNGKLDTLIFGIPKEKYGFSNDARLPDYEKCLFDFNGDTTIKIQIK
jgi:uncharacterized protein (DUF2141 family)